MSSHGEPIQPQNEASGTGEHAIPSSRAKAGVSFTPYPAIQILTMVLYTASAARLLKMFHCGVFRWPQRTRSDPRSRVPRVVYRAVLSIVSTRCGTLCCTASCKQILSAVWFRSRSNQTRGYGGFGTHCPSETSCVTVIRVHWPF